MCANRINCTRFAANTLTNFLALLLAYSDKFRNVYSNVIVVQCTFLQSRRIGFTVAISTAVAWELFPETASGSRKIVFTPSAYVVSA